MTKRSQIGAGAVTVFCIALGGAKLLARNTGSHSAPPGIRQESQNEAKKGDAVSTQHANGSFDVKVVPEGTPDKADGSTLARFSLDKQYHGALEATAKGEMLTVGTHVEGSAGYVAIERVTGTLNGKGGSFVLQHNGWMSHGATAMNVTVVPDSGSGQLVGIAGKLKIIIEGGKHSYEFEYTLPST
jgi:hypothetical protein